MGKYSHTNVTQKIKELLDTHQFTSAEMAKGFGVKPERLRTLKSGARRASGEELQRFDTWLAENHPSIDVSLEEIRKTDETDARKVHKGISPVNKGKSQRSASTPDAIPESMASLGFGESLKAVRTTAGFSQQKLAEQIGCSRDTIKEWESEKQRRPNEAKACPSPEFLGKIIKALYNEEQAQSFKDTKELLEEKWKTLYESSSRKGSVSLGAIQRGIPIEPTKGRGRE